MHTASPDVFSALGDATRRQILDRLRDEGALSVKELAEDLPITRQAVTKHLDTLVSVGLVVSSREGRERRHQLKPEGLVQAHAWLEQHAAAWDRRLERLERHLDR